jgi:hypothetical protein
MQPAKGKMRIAAVYLGLAETLNALLFATPFLSLNHRTTRTWNRRHLDRGSQETKVTFCVQCVVSPLIANLNMHRFLKMLAPDRQGRDLAPGGRSERAQRL